MNFTLNWKNNALVQLNIFVSPSDIVIIDYKFINEPLAKDKLNFFSDNKEENINKLHYWLQNRCILWDYKEGDELDAYICKRLNVDKWRFGRMTEYQGFVALLDGFRLKDDEFSVTPETSELLWFGNIEPDMCQLFRIQPIIPS